MSEPTKAPAPASTKKELPERFKAYKHVWVFVEQERGQVHPVSWELLGAGRKLANKLKVDLAAVVIGPEGEATRAAAAEAFCYGADLAYVVAARMGGADSATILVAHLIPNMLPTMTVQASLNLGWVILNAAGHSFIGLGMRLPTPEWGIMVSEGAAYIFSGEWWTLTFPGFALVLSVFCFNQIGDGLRDVLDPGGRT